MVEVGGKPRFPAKDQFVVESVVSTLKSEQSNEDFGIANVASQRVVIKPGSSRVVKCLVHLGSGSDRKIV
jgi:hypothetical protein